MITTTPRSHEPLPVTSAVRGLVFLLVAGCLPLVAPSSILSASSKEKKHDCRRGETDTDAGCIRPPKLLRKVQPAYPAEARKLGVEGSVSLQAVISTEGHVEDIIVTNAQATDASFIHIFEEAAIAALEQWRYRPGTLDGEPVEVQFTVVLDFIR